MLAQGSVVKYIYLYTLPLSNNLDSSSAIKVLDGVYVCFFFFLI